MLLQRLGKSIGTWPIALLACFLLAATILLPCLGSSGLWDPSERQLADRVAPPLDVEPKAAPAPMLGTKTGRSIAGSAARMGALALIGGLAYKAFQNYQTGKPLITGATPAEGAPPGSGFEPSAVTNDAARLYIRAMIAAAAADGRIDNAEQVKIIGGLKQAGLDAEAEEFLANAMNNPVTPEDLANAVSSPEEAIQVYTAARLAMEPDTRGEQQFLAALAAALGIDNKLAAHIDAATRSAAA